MFENQESQIFILGFVLMLIFSLWFLIQKNKKPTYSFAFLVTSTTALSYLLLFDGTFVNISQFNVPVYYTRWLFYALSCSLLMLTIAKFIKAKKENIIPIVLLNTLVMLTGAIAAILISPMKWIIFILGSLFFIAQILFLFEGVKNSKKSKIIKYYIFFGWALFPVIFIFAPEGLSMIDNYTAALLYLLLDFFTKIVFYLNISKYKN